jgi:hypothetical protein
MAELTSYTGNAGLGLGSNPGIPAISPNDNLKVINDTSRDIMLLDSERNMRLYNQKVKDRDALTELILKNQVEPGNVEADYLPQFMDAKKKSEEAFQKWKGNPNDIEGFKNYQEAISHLQDYTAHARTNTTELQKLKQQRAAETLPWKQKSLDNWINQETDKTKKDPWQLVDPYQQAFNFSIDPINKLYKTGTSTSMSADGLWKYEDTYGDYDQTLKAAKNEYLNNGETSEDIRQFFQQVEQYDPLLKKKFVESVNSQLDKYNKERGLQKGQSGYADQIQLVTGPDGKQYMKTDPTEFAAKYALAQQEKYVSRASSGFQKDYGAYQLGKERNAIAARKLGIDAERANAYVRNLNAKTDKYFQDNKTEATGVIKEYNDFVDNISPQGLYIRKDMKKTGVLDGIFLSDLPESYQYISGPIMGAKTTTDKKGNVTVTPTGKVTVGKLEPFLAAKGEKYYIPKYVDPQTGEKVSLDSGVYRDSYSQSKKNGFPGTYDDYLRTLLKKGAIEMVITGKNGTANYTTMFQSAKAMNAQGTKKGQENIENPPESVAADEQDNE